MEGGGNIEQGISEMQIDIVLPWVDGSDPEWQKIRNQYREDGDDRVERYRDFGILKYLFRGIETFMPWVRTVHFVTMNQIPEWMNAGCEKLHLVDHRDYMPHDCLPTFNSNAIEMNFHRIEGLSEQFLLFNDDFILLRPMEETDWFRNGKPVDMLALQPDVANADNEVMPYIYLNNAMVIARHFNKIENMKQQPWAYFNLRYPFQYFAYNNLERLWPRYTGFFTAHGPSPMLKSAFEELWEMEPEVMETVSHNRFRAKTDVNQYLVREYTKQKGNFVPENILKNFRYFELSDDNEALYECIRTKGASVICINDANHSFDAETAARRMQECLESAFPEKSRFER